MNMKLVRKIARQIRKKCELFANSYAASDCDYYKSRDLACMCAVASFALSKALKQEGIKNRVMRGFYDCNSHCWVELKNGNIVDITVTQFSIRKKVLIVSDDPIFLAKYDKGNWVRYQDLKDWDTQAPKRKLTKKILDIPIKI